MSGDLIPIGQEWQDLKNMADVLVKSGMIPKTIDNAFKAVAIMLKGRELGIPPMQAFSTISIINGTPTMNAQLMLSLVYRAYPAAKIHFKKMTKEECVIEAARPGEEPTVFSFTMADAAAMNLHQKDNWRKMPKLMLKWRCVTEMCRTLFPECLMGVSYTPEEINPDLKVNEEGEVITTEAKEVKPLQAEKLVTDLSAERKLAADRFTNLVERCDAENINYDELFPSYEQALIDMDVKKLTAVSDILETKLKTQGK